MIPPTVLNTFESYAAAKRALEANLGMGDDLMHVHLGLAIFVLSALILRKPMRSAWPIGLVVALALINEVVDYFVTPNWSPGLSLLDIVNSVFWPTLLFLIARRTGRRLSR
jgi:hypothetical protein